MKYFENLQIGNWPQTTIKHVIHYCLEILDIPGNLNKTDHSNVMSFVTHNIFFLSKFIYLGKLVKITL